MKKVLSFVLCILLLVPAFLKPNSVKAYPADSFLERESQATDAMILYVDYFDNKTPKYLKTVPLSYDQNGRMLDDGFDYHLYDRNGHEIMISNPMYTFPFFGDFHMFNSETAKIQFNEDGSPSSYSRLYRTLRFAYDSKGNITTVEFLSGSNVEYILSYTYSGNKIAKIHVEDRSGGAGGQTDYTFDYNGEQISKIHGNKKATGGSYHDETETVYSYDSSKKLKSIEYCRGETVYESIKYSYDGHGRVMSAENYIYDKAEEGYMIFYNYPEEEETETETESETETDAPETEAPATEDVRVIDVSPAKGSYYVKEPTGYVHIYFSETIDQIHPDLGTIRLVNDNTGESFFWDLDQLPKTLREGAYRIYGNRLCFKLPSKLTEGFPGFQTGCTYHLEMDPDFVSFKGTKKKCREGRIWDVQMVWDVNRVRTGTFSFTSTKDFDLEKNRVGTASFRYDPAYFMKTSFEYDPHLAILSLDMAMASYGGFGRYTGSTFIKNFYRALGFPENSIWANADYDSATESDTTGVAIASGKLDEETTLIAIAVRSGNYGMEWGGNFRVGTTATGMSHLGFQIGCDHVLEALKQYISEKSLSGHVKIWIAGYSRGSAIANLTAVALGDGAGLQRIHYERGDIYAYCFEVPATTTDRAAGNDKYRYIFNIVNPVDPVPRLPLYEWGFVRYGRMVYIPGPGTDPATYSLYEGEMKKYFAEIYGQELIYVPDSTQIKGINRLAQDVAEIVEDRDVYGNYLQAGVIPAIQQVMEKTEFQYSEAWAAISLIALAMKKGAPELKKSLDEFKTYWDGILTTWVKASFKPVVNDVKTYFSGENVLEKLLVAHYPELTLAWMEAMEYTGMMEQTLENATRSAQSRYCRNLVKYNCPVSVTAYDRNGKEVASISEDGNVRIAEGSPVDAWTTEDGGKVFAMSNENEYIFVATAEDNGEMQVSVKSEDPLTGETFRITNYYELPLETRKAYTLQIGTGFVGSDYEAALTDPENKTLKPSLEAGSGEIPFYRMDAESIGNGYVSGTGEYPEGEYVVLKAVPYEGEEFLGWADASGKTISEELVLSFHMLDDRSVVARFSGGSEEPTAAPSDETKPKPTKLSEEDANMVKIIAVLGTHGLAAIIVGIILLNKNKKKEKK